ncbi:L-gulonolactone oxidase-like [Saccostrea cucullata]|uniref:L-gulonolactone oxidase-like n=1 Tax=Saccostrea cuccullata TaxID=36930 RepID=UPI002ED2DAB2
MGNNHTKKTKERGSIPSSIPLKATVTQEDAPATCKVLKEDIKACIKNGNTPLLIADESEDSWQTFQELQDQNIFLMDCHFLKEETVMQKQKNLQLIKQSINKLYKRLQGGIGKKTKLQRKEFENWGQTVTASVFYCEPTSKREIQKVILAAAKNGVGVRGVGGSHTWAPVICDDNQILMNFTKLQSDYRHGHKIRIANKSRNEVDVMSGVKTSELKEFQLKHKLNLPLTVMADHFDVVGTISVGAHGAGINGKSISDYIVKMRVFDSRGQLRTYTLKNKSMFNAVSVSFGCFGIIYDVTFKMEKEIVVKTQNMYCSLRDVFYNAEKIKSLAEENWSTQIFWFPYNSVSLLDYEPKNDDLWIRLINKAPSNVDCKDFGFYLWQSSKDKISQKSLAAVSPLLAENTELTPYLSWAAFKSLKYVLYPSGQVYQELPHAIHYRTHIADAPVHDMEFIFDHKGDYNKVLEIIQVVVEKTDHYEEKEEYPLNLCLEMRFMAYSDMYLGCGNVGNPANGGSGHVFCIEIISVTGTKGWEKFSIDVGREWMALGGVPHLAKQWDYLPGIHRHIQEKMCLELKTFKEQLETSKADPRGMFLNKGLKQLLNL